MPLNSEMLKNLIIEKLDDASFNESPDSRREAERNVDPTRNAVALAIAEAVIEHITNNATVFGTCPPGGGPLAGGRIF